MKKILAILFFAIFFSSCPIMEDVTEESVWFRIENRTMIPLNFDVYFEVPSWPDHCFNVYRDSLYSYSIVNIQGFRFNEEPSKPFDFLMSECIKKQLVITALSGDTLAHWNDSSAVFDSKYWMIESQKDGDINCTLQLTDEVLELK